MPEKLTEQDHSTLVDQVVKKCGVMLDVAKRMRSIELVELLSKQHLKSLENSTSEVKTENVPSREEIEFDRRTLIDVSHKHNVSNEAEEKYKRYSILQQIIQRLRPVYMENASAIKKFENNLAADDMRCIVQDMNNLKEKIELAESEQKEIYDWFLSFEDMKKHLYTEFLKTYRDESGLVTTHFDQKLKRIEAFRTHAGRERPTVGNNHNQG